MIFVIYGAELIIPIVLFAVLLPLLKLSHHISNSIHIGRKVTSSLNPTGYVTCVPSKRKACTGFSQVSDDSTCTSPPPFFEKKERKNEQVGPVLEAMLRETKPFYVGVLSLKWLN